MKKYFKIGEISKLYHIGVDSLRYYEKIGVIHPERSESGYRLYSVHDIWRLNVIRELRELGFGMERIGQYLQCHTVEGTVELLQEEQEKISEKIRVLRQLQADTRRRLQNIADARNRPEGQIMLQQLPERRCFATDEGYAEADEMDVLIQHLVGMDKERLYVIGNNQIGTVLQLQGEKVQYQSVFMVDGQGSRTLPGGLYLTVCYRGAYTQSAGWCRALLDHAEAENLRPVGKFLELLWVDNHTTSQISQQITELQLQVVKIAQN